MNYSSSRLPRLASIFALATCWLALSVSAHATHLALALDDNSDQAVVFDTQLGVVVGSPIALGPGAVGDCVILPDESLGFVVDHASNLWVVDLTATPPTLAGGVNPIVLSNSGQDVAVAPGAERLVSCGITNFVSVIDVATRSEIDTFDLGHSCSSVEVCSDGSVLVGHADFVNNDWNVRRLQLSAAGVLSDTAEILIPDLPTNLECAPDGASALVMQFGADVTSVAVPGLTPLNGIVLPNFTAAFTAQFTPAADRVFIRAESVVQAYDHNPVTGALSPAPVMTIANTGTFAPLGGIDTMVLDSGQGKFYVTDGPDIKSYRAVDGAALPSITVPGARLTGLCLPHVEVIFADGFELGTAGRWTLVVP